MNTILPSPLSDIKELYMQRPSKFAHYSLGRWFAEAQGLPHLIKFAYIWNAISIEDSFKQIKTLGLEHLPLERLHEWNLAHRADPF